MVTRSLCLLFLLALSASAQTPRIPPPESVNRNGLIGRWLVPGYQTGNGLTPTQAWDASGKGNHGTTVASPNYGVVYSRVAMALNGSSQYVIFPDSTTNSNPLWATVASQFTVSAWISIVQTGATQGIITRDRGASTNNRFLQMWVAANGKPTLYLAEYNGVNPILISSATTLSTGVWYNLVVTYNAVDGARLFLNAAMVAASTTKPTLTTNPAYATRIGSLVGGAFFNGALSDVRIYNRALTAAEISAIYRGLQ
jgi:hypothetical protein